MTLRFRKPWTCLCVKPFLVSTNMTENIQVASVVAADDCMEGCLRSLGNIKKTCGAKQHLFIGILFELINIISLSRLANEIIPFMIE